MTRGAFSPSSTPEPPPASGARHSWLAVTAVGMATFCVVTTEMLPVGLFVPITAALDVSVGMGGFMLFVPAILAALFQRERTGAGQQLEVPMFESMASYALVEHYYGRHLSDEPGQAGYPRVLTAWRKPCRTADGHVCLMPYTDAHWRDFFIAADRRDLAEDARFADISARTRHIETLYELQAGIVARHDTAYWLALCERLEIPAAPVNRLQDLETDPHLRSVDFFVALESASGSRYRFPRNPVRLQHSHVPATMPPRLGEHTRDVLREAGLDEAHISALLEAGAARDALSPPIDPHKDPA